MICLTGTLLVPEPDRARVAALPPAHFAATRAEPGCLVFHVIPGRCDPGRCDPGRWLVAERFTAGHRF